MTLSISDIQHKNDLPLCLVLLCWVPHFIYDYAECRCAECCNAECRDAKYIRGLSLKNFQPSHVFAIKARA